MGFRLFGYLLFSVSFPLDLDPIGIAEPTQTTAITRLVALAVGSRGILARKLNHYHHASLTNQRRLAPAAP